MSRANPPVQLGSAATRDIPFMQVAREHVKLGRKDGRSFSLHWDRSVKLVRDVIGLLFTNRWLIWALAKREMADRYAGQIFGILWVIGHPLILIGIYIFVFAYVFKLRLGGTVDLPLDYPVYILSGLVSWMTFQDVANKSCTAVTGKANLVKQVVFPIEVLPVHPVIPSCISQLIGCAVVMVYVIAAHGGLPWTYVFLPVVVFLQVLFMIGISLLLSSVSVFFRDLKDIVVVANLIVLYATPIFYLPEWAPEPVRVLLHLNPFSHMLWCYQDVLYFGRFEHVASWLIFAGMAVAAFCAGAVVFRRLKPYFAEAL